MKNTELEIFKKELIETGIIIEQIFSGNILDSDKNSYYVRLYNQTNINEEELQAEMFKDKFPLPNLPNGTIFYWFIGENELGEDFSLIKLTEARWTEEQIRQIELESKKLFEKINQTNINKIAL